MEVPGCLAAAVAATVVFAVIVSFLLPFALVAAVVWLALKVLEALCRRGPALSATDAAARDIGWAVGLLVTGVLWFTSRHHFAALLLGVGAAYLTRALLGMRSRTDA